MASPAAQKAFASGRMGIEGLKKMGSVTSTGGRGNHRGKDIFLNYSEEQKIFRYYISVFFRHHLHSGRFQIGRNRAWWIPHRKDLRLASWRGLGGGEGAVFFFSLLFLPGTYVRIVAIVVVVVFLFLFFWPASNQSALPSPSCEWGKGRSVENGIL